MSAPATASKQGLLVTLRCTIAAAERSARLGRAIGIIGVPAEREAERQQPEPLKSKKGAA